jgi:peptide/nickel transport system substrate-binding protein
MQVKRGVPGGYPHGRYRLMARWGSVTAVILAGLVATVSTAGAVTGKAASAKPILKVALPYSGFEYYPNLTTAGAGNSGSFEVSLGYDTLFHMETSGLVVGELASSAEYTNKTETGFEFTLIHGVKFSDGTPLTAAAVVGYLKYYVAQPGNQPSFGANPKFTAVGKWTVRMNLSTPVKNLTTVLSDVGNNSGAIASPACVANPKLFTNATCGTGPYMLNASNAVPGTSYDYVPNPNYYDKKAVKFSGVDVDVIPEPSSALAAIQSGQLNIAYVGADSSTVSAAKSDGLKVESAPVGSYMLLLNQKDPETSALRKPDVREAISYALDRPALAQLVAPGGYAKADDEFPVTDASDPTFTNYYKYDVAKAKSLLAAAGYPNGLTLNLTLIEARTQDQTMFGGVAQDLSRAGITLKPVNFTSPTTPTTNAGYLLTLISGSTQSQYNAWVAQTAPGNTWGAAPKLTDLFRKGLHAENPVPAWTEMWDDEAKDAYDVAICSISGIWYVSHSVTGVNVPAARVGAPLISEISPTS